LNLIETFTRFALCAALVSVAACNDSGSSSTPASATSSTSTTAATTGTTTVVSSTVAFAAASYSAATTASSITISVNRTGSTRGTASVTYATVNGTAIAGTDYTPTTGAVSWSDGDTSVKTVAIPLTKSAGGKTFKITLADPSGATLASPSNASVSVAAAATVTPGAGNSALSVRVQGDHFIDANSEPIQLRGVNVSGLEFVAVQGWDAADPWGGGAPNFSAIQTWKSNTVRLPLNEASWLGYTCIDGTGASRNPDPGGNYKATVQKAVTEATAAGLYVILDLHWTAPKNFCPLAQNPMADTDNSLNFWTSIATTFKGYPNVLFEMFNEPYLYWITAGETDWGVLMQGGTETQFVTGNGSAYTANYTWQVAGMQQMLNAVRATGATNVVLIAGVTWAQDLSQWAANAPKDPLKQIAAVWHAYPDSGTVGDPNAALPKLGSVAYTYTKSVLTAGYPVLITEFGDHNAAGTVGSPFVSNLLPWADAHGASYTGWTWNAWEDKDNILIKDDTGTPSDGYGVYTKAHYLCVATGSSNCP
jgi:endoglucanase